MPYEFSGTTEFGQTFHLFVDDVGAVRDNTGTIACMGVVGREVLRLARIEKTAEELTSWAGHVLAELGIDGWTTENTGNIALEKIRALAGRVKELEEENLWVHDRWRDEKRYQEARSGERIAAFQAEREAWRVRFEHIASLHAEKLAQSPLTTTVPVSDADPERLHDDVWWCCGADYPNHAPGCRNAKKT